MAPTTSGLENVNSNRLGKNQAGIHSSVDN
jgi:hypothetical protein